MFCWTANALWGLTGGIGSCSFSSETTQMHATRLASIPHASPQHTTQGLAPSGPRSPPACSTARDRAYWSPGCPQEVRALGSNPLPWPQVAGPLSETATYSRGSSNSTSKPPFFPFCLFFLVVAGLSGRGGGLKAKTKTPKPLLNIHKIAIIRQTFVFVNLFRKKLTWANEIPQCYNRV